MAVLKTASGFSWCFEHDAPMPCEKCQQVRKDHPFKGLCFDCKAEYAAKSEADVRRCGCGGTVRNKSFYRYP